MKNKSLKLFILSVVLILISNSIEARKVPGYIVTENSDTIYGEIKVTFFNLVTGGVILDGINLEPLHYEVWFRGFETRRFRKYQSNDIFGFGFKFKNRDYLFHGFTLESKSIFKSEEKRYRFLQLCYIGKVYLYKDLYRINNYNYVESNHNSKIFDNTITTFDYFIFNESIGLTKLGVLNELEDISNLLKRYEFEEEFIKLIKPRSKLISIVKVLREYEIWLHASKPAIFNI